MMTDHIQLGRLKKRSEFLYVRDGTYVARGGVVIQMRKAPSSPPHAHNVRVSHMIRVGFTATRKIGGAVVRNRAKRRLRAVAQALLPEYGVAGQAYVFIARQNTTQRKYEHLLDDAKKALISLAAKASS